MARVPVSLCTAVAPNDGAPQHEAAAPFGPRPLPLFLAMVHDVAQHDPATAKAALAGLRRCQDAARAPPQPAMPIVARAGRAVLRDYGGTGPVAIVVPSLINPPSILDLTERRSLLRWLAAQGVHPLLVDWGDAAPGDPDIGGHAVLLTALIDAVGEPVALTGYCLGGTIAIAAAMLRPVRSLALIATPWRFAGFGDAARRDLAALWTRNRSAAHALGVMPMEAMQAGFWTLDPARTVGKYADYAALDPASDEAALFVAMEDWANDGPPLPYAAAREAFEAFFAHDITGSGQWRVAGSAIDPARLRCPVLDIVSARDRIVPAASATGVPNRITLSQGHVGMMIGGRAREALWNPLADWLKAPANA